MTKNSVASNEKRSRSGDRTLGFVNVLHLFFSGGERVISFESIVSFYLLGVVLGGASHATWNDEPLFLRLTCMGKSDNFYWVLKLNKSGRSSFVRLWQSWWCLLTSGSWRDCLGFLMFWVTLEFHISLSNEQSPHKFDLELRKTARITSRNKMLDNYVQSFLWGLFILSFWWYKC